MDFKNILTHLTQLSEATEETGKGRVHRAEPGGYGRKYDTDEEGDEKKNDKKAKADAPKRGRGRPKKGADDSGEVKKYDNAKGLQSFMIGNMPKKSKDLEKLPKKKHSLKEWVEEVEQKYVAEMVPSGMKPLAVLDPQNKQAGTGVVTSKNPAIQKMLGGLDPKDVQIVMTQQGQQAGGTQPGQKPSATSGGATNQPAMAEEGDYSAKKARAGKDIGKPGKQFAKIAKSAGEKYGSKERGEKVAGAVLAKLRGLKEGDIPSDQVDMGAGLGAGRNQTMLDEGTGEFQYFRPSDINLDPAINTAGYKKKYVGRLGDYIVIDKQNKPVGYSMRNYGTIIGPDAAQWEAFMASPGSFHNKLDAMWSDEAIKIGNQLMAMWPKIALSAGSAPFKAVSNVAQHGGQIAADLAGGATRAVTTPIKAVGRAVTSEAKAKPDYIDLDKDGNKKESMKKAASDAKKTKKKVDESMDNRLKSAHHRGKAHALAKESYNCKYDDMEEARMYHEGYKEGLDECYGQVPIRGGVMDETGMPPATVSGMADQAEGLDEMDMYEMDKTEYMKHKAKTTPGGTFKAFGQTMHDKDVLETSMFESWDKELSSLLTEYDTIQEGLTVSISKGQQGAPDSVSVTAQDQEADELLGLIKSAGLGLFGDEQQAQGPMTIDNGSTEQGDIDVVGDHDGMMALIKKVTGGAGEPNTVAIGGHEHDHEHGDDYEDEEDKEHAHEETCNECGMSESNCGCDDKKEVVDEVESEDQMAYEVAEDNQPDSGAEETAQEVADTAQANSSAADSSEDLDENKHDKLDEWANEAGQKGTDAQFETDIAFMTRIIAGGLNKEKSTGQTTVPVIPGQKDRMGYSAINESINDWKKLAGLK